MPRSRRESSFHRSCLSYWSYSFFIVAALLCSKVFAFELWSDKQGHEASLAVTAKFTSLTSDQPDDPLLFAEEWSQTTLARLRFGLEIRDGNAMESEFAYEQSASWLSDSRTGLAAAGGFLPSTALAPFRITPLDWEIAGDDDFSYRHEIDRAFVALHPAWGNVTVGRQAIGLGRGVIFSAVDVFAPFSPLEVDREWRRGVDALRVEYQLTSTSSAELIGVFSDAWNASALLGRLRGYVGDVDGSLLLGKYGDDFLIGTVVSAAVGDAEVHGELALFDTSEAQPGGTLWLGDDVVTKAVLGSSYTFDIGNGLTALAEYHYSGFGVKDIRNALVRLEDPDFLQRFLRGDTQILGRQALAGQLSYPFNNAITGTFLILGSPGDGSGVLAPSLRLDLQDNVTLTGSGFIPWGREPKAGQLRSEYGATPASLFLQASIYY
jgi:hypothetical protein